MSDLTMTRGTGNVFADLGFDAEEARNLLLRSQTMMALEGWYRASGLTQARAAKELGITQRRLSQLLKANAQPRQDLRPHTLAPLPAVRIREKPDLPRSCRDQAASAVSS